MNQENISFRACVYPDGNEWIAECVDYVFIAQGTSIDSALSNLGICLVAQYYSDKSKNRTALDKHRQEKSVFRKIFERANLKYKTKLPESLFRNSANVEPEVVYC
ncbi:MAG TPA: hypothetical protein PK453_27390 [Leptospiraceae bacterium]|nr:hypothetical protein [Leptospiraceae bacterium]HNF27730.1 hypothetical protein [Leptospiraceae bacterium]HNO26972.1 hypothetical protein [Leptospiraceae bacterium]